MRKTSKYITLLLIVLFTSIRVYAEGIDDYHMPTEESEDKFYFVGSSAKMSGAKVTDSKFSLADYDLVTPIKNQYNTSACWAFATNSSIESNMLVKGLGKNDLSEAHIELATQSQYAANRNTFNRTKDTGGNYLVSSAYVMNQWGPINEDALPFDKLLQNYNNGVKIYASDVVSQKATVDVNSIVFLGNSGSCNDNTILDIKEYLITNGAMATNIYLPFNNRSSSYLNYTGSEKVNHGISIIGWNDNVLANSFSNKPSRNGAWIIKNSYGGNNYQYVSYDDVHICNNVVGFFDTENNVEDNAYYYDNLGVNSQKEASTNSIYLKSVFKTQNTNTVEELKEVSMYFSKINQNYEIYFANGNVSNVRNMVKVASGKSNFVGYKTIKVSTQKINTSTFTIIIRLSDNGNVIYQVSTKTSNSNDNYKTIKFTKGVQFISQDGLNYTDIVNNKEAYHVPIRAYTNTVKVSYSSSVGKTEETSKVETKENNDKLYAKITITPNNVGESNPELNDNPYTGSLNPWVLIIFLMSISYLLFKKLKSKKVFKI